MEQFEAITEMISGALWGWPLIVLLVGTHIFLTIVLKFPQKHILLAMRLTVSKDKSSGGEVNAFGALATALAATIGTGNIVGVGTAIALGGPGAVFWCWITGLFGMATKYSEGLLAVRFRVKTKNGEMLGGPMFALERGLGMKWLAILFCIFTSIAAFGIGNMVQSNAISNMLKETYNVSQYLTGVMLAAIVSLIMIFGVKGIAKVCSFLVPIMAVLYVTGCLVIIGINYDYVPCAISTIIESAFNTDAAGGGIIGGAMIQCIRYGVSRGLFSNESGMGSAPIVAAAAKSKNPVRQALVSMTGTFWDTVIICAITGITLVCTMSSHNISNPQGTELIRTAFNTIPAVGPIILTLGLFTFALSTILGWSYYGEKAIEYLGGKKVISFYRIVWVIGIFIGSVLNLAAVWNIADSMNALMAIPNIISLLLLSKLIVKETRKYLWSTNGIDKIDNRNIEINQLKREKRLRRKK